MSIYKWMLLHIIMIPHTNNNIRIHQIVPPMLEEWKAKPNNNWQHQANRLKCLWWIHHAKKKYSSTEALHFKIKVFKQNWTLWKRKTCPRQHSQLQPPKKCLHIGISLVRKRYTISNPINYIYISKFIHEQNYWPPTNSIKCRDDQPYT